MTSSKQPEKQYMPKDHSITYIDLHPAPITDSFEGESWILWAIIWILVIAIAVALASIAIDLQLFSQQ